MKNIKYIMILLMILLLFFVSADGLAASSLDDSFFKNEENSKVEVLQETEDNIQNEQQSLEEQQNSEEEAQDKNDITQSEQESFKAESIELDTINEFSSETTGIQTITKFEELKNSYLNYDKKPNLLDVIADMPKTIEVYLNNQNTPIEIPVTWETEQDYDRSGENYYLFWAKWDEGSYILDENYNLEGYLPFIEVIIETEDQDTIAVSGIDNIVSRAYHQVNITWSPNKLVDGFRDSKGILTGTYFPGRIYVGLPYGQLVNSGRYVPHGASFDTFLNAVADSNSLFYTGRGSYGKLESTYYGSDCSAFVSYSYGLPRMTTTTIGMSSQFSKVDGNSIYNAQVGDCFNKSGSHTELITGMEYDQNGELVSVEVSEQTPPKAQTIIYTPSEVQNIINKGYTLLRYKQRESVKEPEHYNGCIDNNSFLDTKVNMGTNFCAYIINTAGWIHATNDNGDVRAYSETGKENQIWYFERQTDGSYKITSYEDGKCMEACDLKSSGSMNVKVNNWNGSSSQRWFLYGIEGKYKLRAASQDKVLALYGKNLADGTNIELAQYTGQNGQLFHISKIIKECPEDGHKYNSKVTKKATCTEDGLCTYKCYVCGKTYEEKIKATGHKEVIDAAVEPTCTKEGKRKGSHCSSCDLVLKEQTSIPKINHTYKDVITKAKVTSSGKIENKCVVCGKVNKTSTIYYPKTIILSTTSYVYTGKAKKPSVTIKDSKGKTISSSNYEVIYPAGRTKIGTYSVTIKFKGDKYTGSTKRTFKIIPKSMNLSSVKSNAKGKLTAFWSKNTTITGYEIKYGVKSSFSDAKTTTVSSYKTTSKTISNLTRGKKYYVKMRCYKTVNGVKYYSNWGDTKTVTIRK
ncbi:MAG: RICIN domain-containing protein [Lachnospiraceae bacterium]